MPSPTLLPSAAKRGRGAMSRQLSLQGSTPPLCSGPERRGLHRQSSEDLALRIGSGQQSKRTEKPAATRTAAAASARPKPVRMAWGDRQKDVPTAAPGEGVEVVARRCTGLPRPPSHARLTPNFGSFEKEPHALTRQQLAERLRRAWRDRDRKPNLEIVLAHSRPESASSARSNNSDEIPSSAKAPVRAVHQTDVKQVLQDETLSSPVEDKNKLKVDLGMDLSHSTDVKAFPEIEPDNKYDGRIFLRSGSFSSQYANKENVDTCNVNSTRHSTPLATASERRASFRSSQLLNRTINGSFSDSFEDDNSAADFKIFLAKNPSRPPLHRTCSAPTERTIRSPSPTAPKSSLKNAKPSTPEKKPNFAFKDVSESEDAKNRERLTSRRKAKSVVVRQKPKEKDESSEDEDSIKGENEKKKPPRRRPMPREGFGGEIITMVSLVSPADSDVEDPVLALPLPTQQQNQTKEDQKEDTKDLDASLLLQKCVALRKTTKTVSFQNHPPVSRSCSASFPLRRGPPGAPIIVPTPITVSSAPKDRQPERGVKRRLVRSKTSPANQDEDNGSSDERTDTSLEGAPVPRSSLVTDKVQTSHTADAEEEVGTEEPEMRSPKEKECWTLYKKMLDKGVAVSYDTVLRGMLTPTEYRLRKNQLSRC